MLIAAAIKKLIKITNISRQSILVLFKYTSK